MSSARTRESHLTFAVVVDIAGEMPDTEADVIVGFPLDEVLVLRVIGMELIAQRSIRALGKAALFVDQRDDIHGLDGDQIEYALIVFEGNVFPIDVFVVVLLLFEFEDVMNEELLEILIGVIDAQLFETVALEVLEAEDVQDAEARETRG